MSVCGGVSHACFRTPPLGEGVLAPVCTGKAAWWWAGMCPVVCPRRGDLGRSLDVFRSCVWSPCVAVSEIVWVLCTVGGNAQKCTAVCPRGAVCMCWEEATGAPTRMTLGVLVCCVYTPCGCPLLLCVYNAVYVYVLFYVRQGKNGSPCILVSRQVTVSPGVCPPPSRRYKAGTGGHDSPHCRCAVCTVSGCITGSEGMDATVPIPQSCQWCGVVSSWACTCTCSWRGQWDSVSRGKNCVHGAQLEAWHRMGTEWANC